MMGKFTVFLLPLLMSLGCSENQAVVSKNSCLDAECNQLEPSPLQTSRAVEYGVIKKNQVLPALQKCLQLPRSAISQNTLTVFRNLSPMFSKEGRLASLNGPMMMAIAQLSGELCNDLINFEISSANRTFFRGYKLVAGDQSFTTAEQITLVELAKSCWSRQPTAEEIAVIKEHISQNALLDKFDRQSALFVCTAVVASPQTIIY